MCPDRLNWVYSTALYTSYARAYRAYLDTVLYAMD